MNELNSAGVKGQHSEENCDGLWSSFQNLVSSTLNDEDFIGYRKQLETLKRCSYYIKISYRDPLPWNESPTFSIQDLIGRGKFQQLKKFGSSQVKIQLWLLEELLELLEREKDEAMVMLDINNEAFFTQEPDAIQKKLNTALLDFNFSLPGPLHFTHRIMIESTRTMDLHIQLDLVSEMPVNFDRTASVALTKSVRLYWRVAGPEQGEAGLDYEIRYKLCADEVLDTLACEDQQQPGEEPGVSTREVSGGPTISEDTQHLVIITCSNSIKINSLIPDRSYEFTVKRASSTCWVYGSWSDTIVLKTLPCPVGSTNHKNKRWVYNF
ncbi:fibronectin type III domain-containing protein 11-like [Conger conger]|uniref:fibronectin type III domain-containing protein 11-like n=1 Tax=Conger conger TaxID=82655 RepID=UPI002A5AD985|nr:fibronectin type III domain-containing protein 11-like [Conger conger]